MKAIATPLAPIFNCLGGIGGDRLGCAKKSCTVKTLMG